MTIVVYLASALLCISAKCYPALVGPDTPVGIFPLARRYVQTKGYGGDVLQFAEDDRYVWAIHRVWLGRPAEHRLERLQGSDPERRKMVTHGCINVMPDVYERLLAADNVEIVR